MDDLENLPSTSGETHATFFCSQYDEKLEAEFIMRARSIFDEFVCPTTGAVTISTFTELLHGVTRLWALAQEMKGFTQEIHERLINLPLLFILVLLRLIEKEYTQEDHEKTPADPQLSESLLTIFIDMHTKLPNFKKPRHHKVLLGTCLMFLRHVLTIMGSDSKIKRMKWSELTAKNLSIVSPIRNSDIKIILETLRHFRTEILPKYSKRPVSYKLIFINRYPEIMEPTLERQTRLADFFLLVSVWMIIFSVLALGTAAIVDKAYSPGGLSIFGSTSGHRLGSGPAAATNPAATANPAAATDNFDTPDSVNNTATDQTSIVKPSGNFFKDKDMQRKLQADAALARKAEAEAKSKKDALIRPASNPATDKKVSMWTWQGLHRMKLIDIGANFPDAVFRGIYHGKAVHADDFSAMLNRCRQVDLKAVISTATSTEDYHDNIKIIKEFPGISPKIYTTLGVHPSYCQGVLQKECKRDWKLVDEYFDGMLEIFRNTDENRSKLVAVGECGLDYARLFRSGKDCQLEFFQRHFDLLGKLGASERPAMFLHSRDCATDFITILKKNRDVFPGGVVHSFTGSVEEAREVLEFSDDMYIGLNGCSLRDEQGISVASMLPLDRIMIESDAPYCEMRPSHASRPFLLDFEWNLPSPVDKSRHDPSKPVKGRNEPTESRRVLRVLSKLRGIDEEELSEIIYANTLRLFPQCKE